MSPAKSPTVATYPSVGGQDEIKMCVFQNGKRAGVATDVYSRKTLEKPKRGYANFEKKGSGVVYAQGRYTRPSQWTTAFNRVYIT